MHADRTISYVQFKSMFLDAGESADSELRDHGLASAPGQQNKENMSPSITTSVQLRDGAEGYRISGPGLCSVDHRLRMLASSLEVCPPFADLAPSISAHRWEVGCLKGR